MIKNEQKSAIKTKRTNGLDGQLSRYLDLLERAGLNEKEALIFNALLEKGEMGAGEIVSLVNLKRGDTYNHIYSLKQKGLLEEITTGGWKRFKLEHPSQIEEYVENRSQELEGAKRELSAVLPAILSTYNLTYHKPGVKVFEGADGSEKMMHDSLTAKTEIYSIVDPKAIDKYMSEENKRYVAEREKLGVKKKILVADTPSNRERYLNRQSKVTEIRFIPYDLPAFQTNLQIYDNKVAFHTLNPERTMGVIIEDELIAKLQRSLFEYIWSTAKPL